jgi:hypothetical protein
MTFLKVGVTVVGLGVGFYFGFTWVSGLQEKVNTKRREVEQQSDGGQVGHIADLYDVLDQTDPNRYSRHGDGGPDSETARILTAAETAAGPGAKRVELPLLPAKWTLDLGTVQIPEGRVNGTISGTNFVPDTVRVDLAGTAYVLDLRQGQGVSADRQMLVFLRLKPGETLAGRSWSVSKDMKGAGVPQVAKLWKPKPRFAPVRKNFSSGYAMKLEFGQMTDGVISGKIFLALPDEEQSVVAGVFSADTGFGDTGDETML